MTDLSDIRTQLLRMEEARRQTRHQLDMIRAILGSLALIVIFGVIGALAWGGWQIWTKHQREAQQAANVAVVAGTMKAQQAEGHQAVEAVTNEAAVEASSRALTQSNAQAIHAASGAEVAVQPAEYDAGIRALCKRAVYRSDPMCAHLKHPAS